MAENPKSLLEQGPSDSLQEGAQRFEKLIETVKAQHAPKPVEAQPEPRPNPLLSVGPGEEWSRRFQTQSIGPKPGGFSLSDLAPVPRSMILTSDLPEIVPDRVSAVVPDRTADIVARPPAGDLARQLGKPEKPRRSWLGRMFHRTG